MHTETYITDFGNIFDRYPQLSEIEGIAEDVLVMGDGAIAVVVQSPQTGIVYKIPHPGLGDIINGEFQVHESFLFALRKGRETGNIPDYIKIPSIRHNPFEHNGVFSQEKVDGLTLKSIQLLLRYPGIKDLDRKEMLENFTDYDVKEFFVVELGLDEDDFDFMYNCNALDILGELVPTEKFEAFRGALGFLEREGCIHYDLHNSNVMIDRNGNIFIIDFGKVQ